jgi:hypothetical protein
MASFVAQMIDIANALDPPSGPTVPDLPSNPPDAFTDDGNTGRHEANINRLAAAGIVRGVGGGRFDPTGQVSRAQMATFIAAALAFVRGGEMVLGPDAFVDDDGIPGGHEPNINRLANADIVDGTAAATYGASGTVSRAQMATFVIRAMSYLSQRGRVTPLPAPEPERRAFSSATAVSIVTLDPESGIASTEVDFTGFGATGSVDVALLACSEVERLGDGGIVVADRFFRSEAPAGLSSAASGSGQVAASMDITSVQGIAQAQDTGLVSNVRVVGDRVRVALESEVRESDCAYLVAWVDSEADDAVELWSRSNRPAEAYGVAGPIVFAGGEAPDGTILDHEVVYVDATDTQGHAGFAVTRHHTYFWDLDDTFNDGGGTGAPLTAAAFEALISSGDSVELDGPDGPEYSRTGSNHLQVNADVAGPQSAPPWTSAVTVDPGESRVQAAWVTVAPITTAFRVTHYCAHLYSATAFPTDPEQGISFGMQCGFDPDGEIDRDGSTREFVFDGLFPGVYVFYGQACGTRGCAPPGPRSVPVTVSRAPIGSPLSTTATFVDTDGDADLSPTDLLSFTFDGPMAAPLDGDLVTVRAGGSFADLVCGTSAVCQRSADDRTITLALTAVPVPERRGVGATAASFPYGVTDVVNRAGPNGGFTDASGRLPWDLPVSPDTHL